MKKHFVILMTTILCLVCFANCAPSESVLQTAIASTKEIEDAILEETRVALQAATQEALNIQRTQEFEIGQTQTAQALSVAQIQKNCTPGDTYVDEEGDTDIKHIDILKAETDLENETLTCVIYLEDISSEITVNRTNIEKNILEYSWAVYVDVDNNTTTGMSWGFLGADYVMSIMKFAFGEEEKTGPIDILAQTNIWKFEDDSMANYNKLDVSIDYDMNTITLVGDIPGITNDSLLYFYALDYHETDTLCEYEK